MVKPIKIERLLAHDPVAELINYFNNLSVQTVISILGNILTDISNIVNVQVRQGINQEKVASKLALNTLIQICDDLGIAHTQKYNKQNTIDEMDEKVNRLFGIIIQRKKDNEMRKLQRTVSRLGQGRQFGGNDGGGSGGGPSGYFQQGSEGASEDVSDEEFQDEEFEDFKELVLESRESRESLKELMQEYDEMTLLRACSYLDIDCSPADTKSKLITKILNKIRGGLRMRSVKSKKSKKKSVRKLRK